MAKIFNVNGACRPDIHYMVDLTSRLEAITQMVDAGDFFTINRARQYGKTTTLWALADHLKQKYIVVSLDFQRMGTARFADENVFSVAFARLFLRKIKSENELNFSTLAALESALKDSREGMDLFELFEYLSDICAQADRPIVLMIDEVDSATNNDVFVSFLAQLRADYLERPRRPTFQSVILAGVYDIRNIKRELRPDEEYCENSPWNIAADFNVNMAFEKNDISNMLQQYDNDYHIGMDVDILSNQIFRYTSGYPVLVSRICKLLDERIAGTDAFPNRKSAWTSEGIDEAVKVVTREDNPLFSSLLGKLTTYPELKPLLQELLFNGCPIPYTATASYIKDAAMFGFIRNENETAVISNRIFETVLYNYFISEEFAENKLYEAEARLHVNRGIY